MTVYAPTPQPFTCAICLKPWAPSKWAITWRADMPIPPLCRTCSDDWGTAIGGWQDRNRDRRVIRQISALASAIEVEAYRIQHNMGPLYARA